MFTKKDPIARSVAEMIGAALSFGFMALFVKLASHTLSFIEVVFFRSLLGSIAIGAMLWKEKASWIGKNPKILAFRGIFGFLALSTHFYAIGELKLGTAVMLNYTAPIFVVILARIFLKERTARGVKFAILTSFLGLYLLAAPQFEAKPFAILMGIISGIFAATAYIFIRSSSEEDSPYTIIFYFTAVSTIGTIPLLSSHFVWPNIIEWLWLLGLSVGSFFGQVGLTKSIQTAPVSFVLPFSYLTPVFAAILGAFLLKEYLSFQAMIGGIIIIGSGVAIYLFREKTAFIPLEE
jgi:drug/metabolite transporter (DMT)-like permease